MTCAGSPFLTSTTMRMPWRSLSSRMSAMPSMRFSRTQLGDLLDQARLVDLVGDLGDDDRLLVALARLDLGAGAHHDRAAAGAVGLADARPAADEAGGREVGARDRAPSRPPAARPGVRSWFSSRKTSAVHHLAQVVGRDVGGHAHRDARGAVHQQVREGRWAGRSARSSCRRRWAGSRRCPSRCPPSSTAPSARQARLGVAHGRGRVAVDGAEVALAVHQRRAHVQVLGHAHERVVDGARRRGGGSCPSPRRRSCAHFL